MQNTSVLQAKVSSPESGPTFPVSDAWEVLPVCVSARTGESCGDGQGSKKSTASLVHSFIP